MPLKIIYLDDEPDLCQMLKENFESDQISIQTFTDPKLAFAEIEKNPPDLLFLDLRLTGTTGEEFAAKLKPSIPKVLITGDLSTTPSPLFVKIFAKPFDFSEMEQFINSYLKRPRNVA